MHTQQLNLKWRKGSTSPRSVDGTQKDIFNGKIYVKTPELYHDNIDVYNPKQDLWNLEFGAPQSLTSFAMAVMNGQHVLAGGVREQDQYSTTVNEVAVWNTHSRTWEYPYPPMPTPRSCAQMISYLHYLILVGGITQNRDDTTNVEILDTSMLQWYNAESLPKPCRLNQSARISDTLYLLGHSSYLFRASLPTLVSLATSKEKAAMPIWETLPDIPFQCSSLAAYDISLLAIACPIAQIVPAIHAYNADTNEWTEVGHLPTVLHASISVALPSKELLVVTSANEVYIGTPFVQCSYESLTHSDMGNS